MRLAFNAVLAVGAIGTAGADPVELPKRQHVHQIESAILDERREIFVRLPRGYDKQRRYPVVYVLDGEWGFDLVASYLDYNANEGLYPAVIVTGVRNVNRNRDYVPQVDPRFPYTGGADRFLRFVDNEWRALIERRYASAPQSVLVGHSFGGTFALHTLFTRPAAFDAYIALGASTWVADRVLFDEAQDFFADYDGPSRFVYMAVGEADGGATVPDGKLMAEAFEAASLPAIEWYFHVHPRAEHFLNFTAGLHAGFQALFPRWQFETQMMEAARAGGADAVAGWFDDKSETLGWRFRPSWFDIGVAAFRLGREGHHDAAVCAIDRLRDYFPDDPNVLSFAASIYRGAGNLESARSAVTRAIAETHRQGADPNVIQLPRLQRQLDTIEAQMTEADAAAP